MPVLVSLIVVKLPTNSVVYWVLVPIAGQHRAYKASFKFVPNTKEAACGFDVVSDDRIKTTVCMDKALAQLSRVLFLPALLGGRYVGS